MQRLIRIVVSLCIVLVGGIHAQDLDGKLGIGFNLNGQKLLGDTRSGSFVYGGSPVMVRFNFNNRLFLDSDIAYSQLKANVNGAALKTKIINFGVKGGYRLFLKKNVSPFIYCGMGVLNFKLAGEPFYWDGYGSIGVGAEYFVHPSVGLNLTGDFRYTTGDDFDGGSIANGKDGFFNLSLGINYYFAPGKPAVHPSEMFSAEVEDTETPTMPPPDLPLQNGVHQITAIVDQKPDEGESLKSLQVEKERLLSGISERERELRLLLAKRTVMTEQMEELRREAGAGNGGHRNGHTKDEIALKYDDGLLLYATGKFGEAIDAFSGLVTHHAEHTDIGKWWYWLGESYFAQEDYISAISAFENALAKGVTRSKTETVELMLAMSRWHGGYFELAYTGLRQLLMKDPPRVYEDLIHEYLDQIESGISE